MITTKELILQFIDYKGFAVSFFCKKVKLSNGFFTNKGAVGSGILHNILKEFPEINPTWLLTGEGSMLKEDEKKAAEPVQVPRDDKYVALLEEQIAELKVDKAELQEDKRDLKAQLRRFKSGKFLPPDAASALSAES